MLQASKCVYIRYARRIGKHILVKWDTLNALNL